MIRTIVTICGFLLCLTLLGPLLDGLRTEWPMSPPPPPPTSPCPENGGWEYLGNGKYQCYTKRGKKTVQVQL